MKFFKRSPLKKVNFSEVPIRDNFYQTSSFFPKPVTLISTLAADGQTNLGAYSLCFPYIISGNHSMLLISRGSSNTSQNILQRKKAAINFIPDKKAFLENCVELGYPGESTDEKMKQSIFTLLPSSRNTEGDFYPEIIKEAVQVFECTWDETHAYEINENEFHFVLRIEKILLQPQWKAAMERGNKFPKLPVDYGFRDGLHFWFSDFSKPYSVDIPKHKQTDATHILFQANRIDPMISWELEACEKLIKVPKIFLNKVLKGIVAQAKEKNVTQITLAFMEELQKKDKN